MAVLVTGSAGFIGYHVAERLLGLGMRVIGIDNLNAYYDVELKHARLARLSGRAGFRSTRPMSAISTRCWPRRRNPDIDTIVHLAAQAGVRYSLSQPLAYVDANVKGQVVMLETARRIGRLRSFIYASSSSVYGANAKLPYSVEDRVDHPVSLYAATKRAAELVTESYCSLYKLPCTGLRFFTVTALGAARYGVLSVYRRDRRRAPDQSVQRGAHGPRFHLYRRCGIGGRSGGGPGARRSRRTPSI